MLKIETFYFSIVLKQIFSYFILSISVFEKNLVIILDIVILVFKFNIKPLSVFEQDIISSNKSSQFWSHNIFIFLRTFCNKLPQTIATQKKNCLFNQIPTSPMIHCIPYSAKEDMVKSIIYNLIFLFGMSLSAELNITVSIIACD